jgi:dTDP-4-dehydrorhamnose 3,5-epimerase
MSTSWLLTGAIRDEQSITTDWVQIGAAEIDGVVIKESRWVVKGNGALTELFRADWFGEAAQVAQVFQVCLNAGGVSAWHAHEHTTDRLFVAAGSVRLVLYDARQDAGSRGRVCELLLSDRRPRLVVVPPRVWHGVENIGDVEAVLVNMPDRAYEYERPDHWRLPPDTPQIPFTLRSATGRP